MMTPTHVSKIQAIRFLKDFRLFGSRGHLLTATALRDAINDSIKIDDKKLLAVKVYTEFYSALEDLGALCIAIRHREDKLGLVYCYLTYGQYGNPYAPKTKVIQFYEMAADGNILENALLLPALKDLIANNPELSETIVPQVYSEANILLSQASQAYLHEERAFVRAYNKTKHGFVVINDKHIFQVDPPKISQKRSWIVSDVPKYDPVKDPNSSMVELFSVELKDVDPMIERIGVIRGAVVALCDITLYLLEQEVITTV